MHVSRSIVHELIKLCNHPSHSGTLERVAFIITAGITSNKHADTSNSTTDRTQIPRCGILASQTLRNCDQLLNFPQVMHFLNEVLHVCTHSWTGLLTLTVRVSSASPVQYNVMQLIFPSVIYTYTYVSSVLYIHKRKVQYYQNRSRSAFSVLCCRYCVCMSLISTSLFGSSKSPPLNDFELKAVESPATDGISFALRAVCVAHHPGTWRHYTKKSLNE